MFIFRNLKTLFYGALLLSNSMAAPDSKQSPAEKDKDSQEKNSYGSMNTIINHLKQHSEDYREMPHAENYPASLESQVYQPTTSWAEIVKTAADYFVKYFDDPKNPNRPRYIQEKFNEQAEQNMQKGIKINQKLLAEQLGVNRHFHPLNLQFEKYNVIGSNNTLQLKEKISATTALNKAHSEIKYMECLTAITIHSYRLMHTFLTTHLGEEKGSALFDKFFGDFQSVTPDNQRMMYGLTGPLAATAASFDNTRLFIQNPNPISFFFEACNPAQQPLPGTLEVFENTRPSDLLGNHPGTIAQNWNVMTAEVDGKEKKSIGLGLNGLNVDNAIKQKMVDSGNSPFDYYDYFLAAITKKEQTSRSTFSIQDINSFCVRQFSQEKLQQLLDKPEQLFNDYQVYLREEEANVRKLRDEAYNNGTLQYPKNRPPFIQTKFQEQLITPKENLVKLAALLHLRLMPGSENNHTISLINDHYETILRFSYSEINSSAITLTILRTEANLDDILQELATALSQTRDREVRTFIGELNQIIDFYIRTHEPENANLRPSTP